MSGSGAGSAFSAFRPRSSTSAAGAADTAFVNGFQSTDGLSTTEAGIVCVTMRSMTLAIVRWRASASFPASA